MSDKNLRTHQRLVRSNPDDIEILRKYTACLERAQGIIFEEVTEPEPDFQCNGGYWYGSGCRNRVKIKGCYCEECNFVLDGINRARRTEEELKNR